MSDTSRIESLVKDNLNLVHFVVTKMLNRCPVEYEELVCMGNIGLLQAANKYNPSFTATFATYAVHRIRGSILDELRKQDFVPRSIRSKKKLADSLVSLSKKFPNLNIPESKIYEEQGLTSFDMLALDNKLVISIQDLHVEISSNKFDIKHCTKYLNSLAS